MTPLLLARFQKFLSLFILLMGTWYAVAFLWVALSRITFPYELEWTEGGTVIHVQRVLDGQPIYVAPTVDFVPYMYTPLYYFVSAAVAKLIGMGFTALRLVSFAASLGTMILIFLLVHKRTRSPFASFIGASLFLASFKLSGAWFDTGRVDNLGLFLAMAGICAFESPRLIIRSLLAPVLVVASVFTKQTMLILGLSLAIAALFRFPAREKLVFGFVFGSLAAGLTLMMNSLSDGWFLFYTFHVPGQQAFEPYMVFKGFWVGDVARIVSVSACFCLVPFFVNLAPPVKLGRIMTDGAILGSLFISAWLSRLHNGGYLNVLMPLYTVMMAYTGIGYALAAEKMPRVSAFRCVLLAALAFQFLNCYYTVASQIPTPADRDMGRHLLATVSRFKGRVFLSAHPYYLALAGKPTHAVEVAITDIYRAAKDDRIKAEFYKAYAAAVCSGDYEAFILDDPKLYLNVPKFYEQYDLVDTNLTGQAFFPVTGAARKPMYLYVRKSSPAPKPAGP